MAEIKLTDQNFEQEVLHADMPVLVDFWASWCGPCQMLAPVIAEIAEEYAGKVKVGKVNVDEQPNLANRYGIASIPTVMLFKNGEVVNTSLGYRPKNDLETMLK
ncbi:MAG: thioredoxin [Clostridiales bacterium]|nr:thioredoxin [Clostridiales bacterium]